LLDIYHTDLAIGTLTDEAGGALYGPDKLADLGIHGGESDIKFGGHFNLRLSETDACGVM
jgi:hypothetical protein